MIGEFHPGSSPLARALERSEQFIRRFVVLGNPQAAAVVLWLAHTHAFTAADATPYLSITSAEKACGKTRLLEVLSVLVARPWFTGRTTTAALTRKIEAEEPTLLLDESDAAFKAEREYAEVLRGLLNTGYRRGGAYTLCVGKGADMKTRDFSTYCPKAIAGIGRLPDTVASRSIPIRLKRRRHDEELQRYRERRQRPAAAAIASELADLLACELEGLRDREPELPEELSESGRAYPARASGGGLSLSPHPCRRTSR